MQCKWAAALGSWFGRPSTGTCEEEVSGEMVSQAGLWSVLDLRPLQPSLLL